MRTSLIIALVFAGMFATAGSVAAQRFPREALDSIAADTLRGPSPRGAFVRSLVVPGWGQASVGAYHRGAVFFGIQSTSWYMLLRSVGKLSAIRGIEARRVVAATDSLLDLMANDPDRAEQLSDPIAFDNAVASDPGVAGARDLVRSRKRHRQDWITYTLFFTMMSGVDAYVAAHLRGFPAVLVVEPRGDGGLDLGVSMPVGSR